MKALIHTLLLSAAVILSGCEGNLSLYEASFSDPKLPKVDKKNPNVKTKNNTPKSIDPSDVDEDYDVEKDYPIATLSPGSRPPITSDEAGLWMMMDRVEDKLKTSGNVVEDPKLTKYVRDLVCKLAGSYCSDVRTYVMRIPAFNATMRPNGVMEVWTGLLLRVRNEAQLATVLGHEIGHFLRRHSLQRMRDTIEKSNALVFFQLATAAVGVPSAGSLAAIALNGSIASFSRDNEREADGYGLRFMYTHGYDLHEAPKIWDQVKKEYDALGDDAPSGSVFYASHPPMEERSSVLKQLASKMMKGRPKGKKGRESFLKAILPHRGQFLRDELNFRRYKRFQALLKMLFDDGVNVGELHYFQGELYRIRDEDGDKKKAMESYKKATVNEGAPPEVYREIGLLHYKEKEKEKAASNFKKYLELKPHAIDRSIVLQMM